VATQSYETALQIAESLTREEQLRLIEKLNARAAQDAAPEQFHSILELRGLGADLWEGIDAQEYVNNERDSWNG
jgi:hypothetical protein